LPEASHALDQSLVRFCFVNFHKPKSVVGDAKGHRHIAIQQDVEASKHLLNAWKPRIVQQQPSEPRSKQVQHVCLFGNAVEILFYIVLK